MIGDWIARRSKARPSDHSASPCDRLLPTKRFSTIHLISCAVHQEEAAPPALELEEALGLRVDLGEQVVVFLEVCVCRIEVFEILDKMGAVERSGAKIARQKRGPRSAEDRRRHNASGFRRRCRPSRTSARR